jgi:hypothetical protein
LDLHSHSGIIGANLSNDGYGFCKAVPPVGGNIRWDSHFLDQFRPVAPFQKVWLYLDVFIPAGILSVLAYWMGLCAIKIAFLIDSYGFGFRYPATWTLEEEANLIRLSQGTLLLAVAFQRKGEDAPPATARQTSPAQL